MAVFWKGRELASSKIKIRKEIIDGEEIEILYNIPQNWTRLKFKDELPDEGGGKEVSAQSRGGKNYVKRQGV